MSKFSAFLMENVERLPNKKIIVSKRFKDENGKPYEWEIRALNSEETEQLQRKALVNVPMPNNPNVMQRVIDEVKFKSLLLAYSVVNPDLKSAELQDSYGVKTPEALLKKMLYPYEEARLAREVIGYTQIDDLGELVEQAKN